MSEDLGYTPVRTDDEKEREELIVKNLPLIRYMVSKNCSKYMRDDAEQEAVIKLWQFANKHDPKRAKFSTYAGTCVRNKVIDMTKGEQRRLARFRPLRNNEDSAYLRTPLDIIIQNEERISFEQLHKAVQDLPLHERYVITFRHGLYDESPHTLREIGSMMKVSYGNVKTIEQRAYRKLRAALTADCA